MILKETQKSTINKNNKISVITFKTGSEIDINIFITNGLAM